uniref:(northern house mosquito) hypothetical protein n=1 Tax=Culex pipiens TaxID=7175 RepID=A0A8D8B2Z9_CULPI
MHISVRSSSLKISLLFRSRVMVGLLSRISKAHHIDEKYPIAGSDGTIIPTGETRTRNCCIHTLELTHTNELISTGLTGERISRLLFLLLCSFSRLLFLLLFERGDWLCESFLFRLTHRFVRCSLFHRRRFRFALLMQFWENAENLMI